MIYRKPEYYDEFRCLAGGCPNTCCTGWEIAVDVDTLERYRNIPGELGRKLFHYIDWTEECFLPSDGRCSFLAADGLCEIQKEYGPEALCVSCREYPRHTEEFPGIREFSLSMSCPEAARLILFSEKNGIRMFVDDRPETEEYEDFDASDGECLEELTRLREVCLDLLAQEQSTAEEKKKWILGFADCTFDPKSEESRKLLNRLYRIEPDWKQYLKKLNRETPADADKKKYRIDLSAVEARVLSYFIYVYLAGAVYDRRIGSKLCLAVFCAEWIGRLIRVSLRENPDLGEAEAADLAARFCREIEHSDENLEILEEGFYGLQ